MCGIAGYISQKKLSKSERIKTAERIISTIKHRGPDNEGKLFLDDHGITLLHQRLSIIDLSDAASQPMTSNTGRFVVTYNGEIYNYLELKNELANLGNNFKTSSDTEVLLTSIEQWGLEGALSKFIGMFAFAIYDKKLRELTIVRDRFGEKPLYYTNLGSTLVFGSELKALKAHPDWVGSIDQNSLNLYLKYSYIPSPKSIYKNVFKLSPGSYIIFKVIGNECKEIKKKKWYVVESKSEKFKGSYIEALKETENLLNKSINYQKISDVPIGVFLSGGIDSTLVATLMQNSTSKKVETFTLGYANKEYDESIFAKKIANYIGTEHNEWIVKEEEVADCIISISKICDEPFADSSLLPTFLISKLAKKKVKVCLTGDAADELFGGYNRYIYAPKILKLKRYPLFFRKFISRLILIATPSQWREILNILNRFLPSNFHFLNLTEKLYKLSEVIELNNEYQIYDNLISTWKKVLPSLSQINSDTINEMNNFYINGDNFEERMMFADLNNYLVDDILVKVDRSAMNNSLETRVPFLNNHLVNFSRSLPLSMKIDKNGQRKKLLKDILCKYIPNKMIERPKAGFGIPIDTWLTSSLKEWASDLLHDKKIYEQNYLNYKLINKKWKQHLSGEKNNHHELWNILMFQSWLEEEKN